MRLSLCLLMVILAICCYESDAAACPELTVASSNYLLTPEKPFRLYLSKFGAPAEATEAFVEAKKCTDQISLAHRLLIKGVVAEIIKACDV
ncbi:secretoglobin family 1D member 2-like [Ochotona curzoniae]|uniref:secretoglobin family 1D member 2-like n=1 Tax=Ochotona curzoniae TaxID=130825 RepID=UPI001B34F2AD|nr:secretoglobin family 1D member 2-like [Ochotona curzoniae]